MVVRPYPEPVHAYESDARYWTAKRLCAELVRRKMLPIAYRLSADHVTGRELLALPAEKQTSLLFSLSLWKELQTFRRSCVRETAACILQRAVRYHQHAKERKDYHYAARIVKELIDTEQSYVQQLDLVGELIVEPLRRENQTKRIMPEDQLHLLTTTFVPIQRVNNALLMNLIDTCHLYSYESHVGDVFLQFTPFLKVYSDYCKMYERINSAVTGLSKSSEKFTAFVARQLQFAPPPFRNHTLQALLITPVQRLPRYRLLLADLLKHTPPTHPDHLNIAKALDLITQIAFFVNETSRAHESVELAFALSEATKGLPPDVHLCEPGRVLLSKVNARIRLTTTSDEQQVPADDANGKATPQEPRVVETAVTVVLFNDMVLLLVTDVAAQMINAGLRLLSTAVGLRSPGSAESFTYFAHYPLEDVVFAISANLVAMDSGLVEESLVFASQREAAEWYTAADAARTKRLELCSSLKARTSGKFKPVALGEPDSSPPQQ